MSETSITHKRGDSLDLLAAIPSAFADGHFSDWSVSAQVRTDNDQLVANLHVQWIDPPTTRTLRLQCIDTRAWKPGRANFDIELRHQDGYTISTATGGIYVVKDVTRD